MYPEKPLSLVVIYGLALGAVYKASQRGLTKHIKRLQPEDEDEKDKDKETDQAKATKDKSEKDTTASEAESQTPKEGDKPKSKRAKWRDVLLAIGMTAAAWGIGLLMGIGLPKIASPRFLDMAWMSLVGFQMWIVYQKLIENVLPDPRCLEVTWPRWNAITWTESVTVPTGPAPESTTRQVVAAVFTLATLAGVYTGTEWIMAFPISAVVYNSVSSVMIPDRPVRSIFKWMTIIKVGVIGFTGLIMGGLWLYRLYFPRDGIEPKKTEAKPSPEVLLLMMMFSSTIPLAASGTLIGLSLRFDYTQALKANLITAPTLTSSTKFVKLPSYPKPFFKASLVTLAMVLFNYGIIQAFSPNEALKGISLMIYASGLPASIVAVRMMTVALRDGVWEDLMGYTELGKKALKEQREEERDVERTEHEVFGTSEKELIG